MCTALIIVLPLQAYFLSLVMEQVPAVFGPGDKHGRDKQSSDALGSYEKSKCLLGIWMVTVQWASEY
jgi:hypothetical protein